MNFMDDLGSVIGEDGLAQLGFDKDGKKVDWAMEGRLLDEAVNVNTRLGGTDTEFADNFTEAEVRRYVSAFQTDLGNIQPTRELVERYVRGRGRRSDRLVEAVSLGLGLKALVEANPFHDKGTGKFSSPEGVVSNSGGSKSFQFSGGPYPDRLRSGRMGTDRKSGKRRALIQWVKAKQPCGRRARQQGVNLRCWDGKKLESVGVTVSKGASVTDDLAALKNLAR